MASRIRPSIVLVAGVGRINRLASHRSVFHQSGISVSSTFLKFKKYSTTSQTSNNVKVPIVFSGGSGNYATALFLAAKKAGVLENVEAELLDFLESSRKSPSATVFFRDLSLPKEKSIKAITEICSDAKFSDITRNFLTVVAQERRFHHLQDMVNKFTELTAADRREVKAIVTSVIPLPPQEKKDLIEILEEKLQGKKVVLEQKIDRNILGGIVVEFDGKLFDMSIRSRARQMEKVLRQQINFSI